ncbi:transporter substrate-binding domain-containing protein [Oleiagrimonas soli]|uniref:MxaJ protein n=1 Tax=Oleiagrimonas soli TaxID=1543381 RepID=A0A841KHS1_9GAMM|nr:transporter substrate-binding domain-containing protein [Oleiagrimonas soli]MBB6184595.1 mxaJ protein [Oleiagrimonas soli]
MTPLRTATLFAAGMLALTAMPCNAAHAASPSAGTLKVCADPNYLPYSDHDGKGFENAVARYVADQLGDKLDYVWANSRGHGGFAEYLAQNLDSGRCDVVMNMPYGNDEELTTAPYYVSSYVFVFKKNKGYDLSSLDSPDLRKLKIGFESETPVEAGLQLRGMVTTAKAYDVGGDNGTSPSSVLDAVENGTIDVMITWQPSIGAFLKKYPDLTTVALPNSRATGSPEMYSFPMSMAVRKGDEALKKRLDAVIKAHGPQLQNILRQHGVELAGDGDANRHLYNDTAGL